MFSILYSLTVSVFVIVILVLMSFSIVFFFFKQKTAYEMRISDWSSDVCSSDLIATDSQFDAGFGLHGTRDLRGPTHEQSPRPTNHLLIFGGIQLVEIGRASCRERVCQYV